MIDCEFRIQEDGEYYCKNEMGINPRGDCKCTNCIEEEIGGDYE